MMLMKADKAKLTRNAYNLAGVSITPEAFGKEVAKLIPGFQMGYAPNPDKTKIASSWPNSLDDTPAQQDFGWSYKVSLYDLAHKILTNIDESYKKGKKLNL